MCSTLKKKKCVYKLSAVGIEPGIKYKIAKKQFEDNKLLCYVYKHVYKYNNITIFVRYQNDKSFTLPVTFNIQGDGFNNCNYDITTIL